MLKKCLLGLFVGFVGFIGFSSADLQIVDYDCTLLSAGVNNHSANVFLNGVSNFVLLVDGGNGSRKLSCHFFSDDDQEITYVTSNKFISWELLSGTSYDRIASFNCDSCNNVATKQMIQEIGGNQDCPEIDTGSILSGACDTNYCVQNDLCPSSSGSRSELMINNIVHEGKPLINISIPDNIYWDYATDDNQFDLYVGSGYNQDYIDSVLAINSYRPDNKDFTNIFVSGLTLIFPYIFVALLIVFIWKLLKRIFK